MRETKKSNFFIESEIYKYVLLAFLLNVVLEIMNRHSLLECLKFIAGSPLVFLYNMIIILITLTLGLIARRKVFTVITVSFIWLVLGITNCIVLFFRTTPFSAIDTLMLKNAFELFDAYFSAFEAVLIIAGLILAIIGLVVLWIRTPKQPTRNNFLKSLILIMVLFGAESAFTHIAVKAEILSDNFENLSYAYQEYGFAYCFTNSLVDVGISKPENYSEKIVDEIKEPIEESEKETSVDYKKVKPNIIMIQLESFFDVNYINDVAFSQNPIPNFTKLKKNYSSGFLTVPSVGAGTANTEFEVLTGMSTAFFGAGEYPYKTIMTRQTAESIAYLLKNKGYSTHAIHNNDGTFYSRNVVFSNLGFDTFTPIEYMYNVEQNPKGWAKDNILPGEIKKCLDSSDGSDFVFTVSVQGHGRYPSTVIDNTQTITSSGNDTQKTELEYYVNQIHEMDTMVGKLIKQIKASKEPTVLVLYGDHLPTLGLNDERLDNKNMYQTEYVVWDNLGLKKQDKDLYSYQLGTHLFDMLGYEPGIMQEYHKQYMNSKDYQKDMEILEYDMLYGDHYIYEDKKQPYEPTDMKMGIDVIKVRKIKQITSEEKSYYVTGTHFNPYSIVYVNEKAADTEYISESKLKITGTLLKSGDKITVGQTGEDHVVLGYSNQLIVNK